MSLLAHLADICRADGWPLYCVGGCVRDRLLGWPAKDIDVVGQGAMVQARDFASRTDSYFVPLDVEQGCARVIRRDRLEQIDFSELRGPDLVTDLQRRDFTINAVACAVTDWFAEQPSWIDPTGGAADLQARRLRVCGPGSLPDDPLRVLRAHRFAAALGLAIEPATERHLVAVAPRLAESASERILAEWMHLLADDGCLAELPRMAQLGALAVLLPDRPAEAVAWVAALEPPLTAARVTLADWMAEPERVALLRFGALVGTERDGPALETLIERFALSRAQRRAVQAFRRRVPQRDVPLRALLASWLLKHGELGIGAWLISAARGEVSPARLDDALALLAREVLPAYRAKPWVTGGDLQRLGARPGPIYKRALHAARLGQVGGKAADRDAALAMAREVLERDGRID